MKLTKPMIEEMAKAVRRWASAEKLGRDWSLFYNGKLLSHPCVNKPTEDNPYRYVYTRKTERNVDPHDYSEWFSEKFIMGMSYDGQMYECINGYNRYKAYEKLEQIAKMFGCYIEHCDSCHCEFVWDGDDIEDVEYTLFVKEKPVWLHRPSDAPDDAIASIMTDFYRMATEVGDKGACTMGEHIEFRYKGGDGVSRLYRMSMQTPYQGEWSWRKPLPEVKRRLELCGATEIYIDYGRLD